MSLLPEQTCVMLRTIFVLKKLAKIKVFKCFLPVQRFTTHLSDVFSQLTFERTKCSLLSVTDISDESCADESLVLFCYGVPHLDSR